MPEPAKPDGIFAVYDSLDIAVILMEREPGDPVFRYAYANPAHQRLTGLHMAELAGASAGDILDPGPAARMEARQDRCIARVRPLAFTEHALFHGRRQHWAALLQPSFSATGHERITGFLHPLTEPDLSASQRVIFGEFAYQLVSVSMQAASVVEGLDLLRRLTGDPAHQAMLDNMHRLGLMMRHGIDRMSGQTRALSRDALPVEDSSPDSDWHQAGMPSLMIQRIRALLEDGRDEAPAAMRI
ncbi:PAS domain-containing protein [Mangrovicoccus sp. HB161399]|uniref:PAS domain-containing protein n=1 Tax=Mangrovicoccus sp. HB161399 TaxID=2720392 RepID=UPI001557ED93|nr:PAS domain-containing protein [Mangrovicoccus sp. HB161399]